MTQEEKAKAYDEVIERAKKVLLDCTSEEQKVVEYITPELKESEDERIRKWIIGVLSTYEHDKDLRNAAIAWLEKQAEHKKFRDSIQVGDKVTKNEDGVLVNLSQLKRVAKKDEKQSEEIIPLEEIILNVWELGNYWKELTKGVCNTEHGSQLDYIVKHWKEGEHYIKSFEKQGKQKPVVIPKFRVGDKVKKGYLTYTVEDIGEDSYKLQAYSKDGDKGSTVFLTIGYEKDYELVEQKSIDKVEPKFKVGDIIRLKDGDGLEWTVEEVFNNGYYTIVCADRDDFIQLDDKWELVEQKPEWSEEDEYNYGIITTQLTDGSVSLQDSIGAIKWFKSLKDRVLPKQEWSEEDSPYFDDICELLINILHSESRNFNMEAIKKDLEWLQSLKPQSTWKPDKAVIQILELIIQGKANPTNYQATLMNLVEQLKKLKS